MQRSFVLLERRLTNTPRFQALGILHRTFTNLTTANVYINFAHDDLTSHTNPRIHDSQAISWLRRPPSHTTAIMPGVTVRDVDVSSAEPRENPASCEECSGWDTRTMDEGGERSEADVRFLLQAQKFINAYAAFLKRQGKLQIPGSRSPLPTSLYIFEHVAYTTWPLHLGSTRLAMEQNMRFQFNSCSRPIINH